MTERPVTQQLMVLRRAPVRVAALLRNVVAFLMEGDIITGLQRVIGSELYRGEERSLFDVGRLINGSDPLDKIVAVDVKTLIMSLRESLKKSGRRWIGVVFAGERQQDCDLFCIGFPLSRNRDWVAIHPRTIISGKTRIWQLVHSEAGHRIENHVPPKFWPLMVKLDTAANLIDGMRSLSLTTAQPLRIALQHGQTAVSHKHKQPQKKERSGIAKVQQYGLAGNCVQDLGNRAESRFAALISHLRTRFAQRVGLSWRIDTTRYQPYTADFAIRRGEHEAVFVEVKLEGWYEVPSATESQSILVEHSCRHPNDPAHRSNFSYTGPRATYILTEEANTSDNIELEPGTFHSLPKLLSRRWLFFHRRQTPDHFWNNTEQLDLKLQGQIDRSCLIDFARSDLAEQMMSVISSQSSDGKALPDLEDLRLKTQDELRTCLAFADQLLDFPSGINILTNLDSDAEEGVADIDDGPYAVDNVKMHREHYVYQAWTALQVLGLCRINHTGLLYDWESNAADCRTYAFTPYAWTESDRILSSRYPRQNPVELFHLSDNQPFLLLSFGLVRPATRSFELYAHPYVLDTLHKDVAEQTGIEASRIVIFQMEDAVTERLHWPLYAIPASAIDCDKQVKNHSRWRKLVLREGEDVEDYRYESMVQALQHFSGQIVEHGKQSVRIGRQEVAILSRETMFRHINADGQAWLDYLRSQLATIPDSSETA